MNIAEFVMPNQIAVRVDLSRALAIAVYQRQQVAVVKQPCAKNRLRGGSVFAQPPDMRHPAKLIYQINIVVHQPGEQRVSHGGIRFVHQQAHRPLPAAITVIAAITARREILRIRQQSPRQIAAQRRRKPRHSPLQLPARAVLRRHMRRRRVARRLRPPVPNPPVRIRINNRTQYLQRIIPHRLAAIGRRNLLAVRRAPIGVSRARAPARNRRKQGKRNRRRPRQSHPPYPRNYRC